MRWNPVGLSSNFRISDLVYKSSIANLLAQTSAHCRHIATLEHLILTNLSQSSKILGSSLFSFNRLAVGAVDESSFAQLTKLQVLDISTGNTDLPTDGETTEEEEET